MILTYRFANKFDLTRKENHSIHTHHMVFYLHVITQRITPQTFKCVLCRLLTPTTNYQWQGEFE